jgi:hypothetical protein
MFELRTQRVSLTISFSSTISYDASHDDFEVAAIRMALVKASPKSTQRRAPPLAFSDILVRQAQVSRLASGRMSLSIGHV